jgi:tetratricopeptide (TPR) repeat protein
LDSIFSGSESYEKALVLDRSAANLNNYAWDLATHDANLEYALALTQESNTLQSLEPTYLDTWAWVLYKLGRYAEAQDKISVALQLLRTSPDAVIFRHAAAIEEALGNVETANDYRQKAKELSN